VERERRVPSSNSGRGMIPWGGRVLIRTYNPAKIVKYGLLVRMVCESKTGYICNMEIYTDQEKKLNNSILSLLHHTSNWDTTYTKITTTIAFQLQKLYYYIKQEFAEQFEQIQPLQNVWKIKHLRLKEIK